VPPGPLDDDAPPLLPEVPPAPLDVDAPVPEAPEPPVDATPAATPV
jgi:hypothetical protein